MKLNFKSLFFFFSCLLIGAGCSNDSSENPENQQILKTGTFTYKNTTYTSTYKTLNDSSFVFTNPDVDQVYQELVSNPTLATLVNSNGSIELFDNNETLEAYLLTATAENSGNQTRATPSANMTLREHQLTEIGKGRELRYSMTIGQYIENSSHYALTIPDLRTLNFNDILTGIHMSSVNGIYTIQVFEHPNYGGKSISFKCTSSLLVNDLGDYKLSGSIFGGGKNWDNEASSIRVYVTPW